MRRFEGLFLLLIVGFAGAVAARERPERLDFSTIGIYGTVFDFCDYSVFKMMPQDDPGKYGHYGDMVDRTWKEGKLNLVGLYCFDRVQYKKPIAEAKRMADEMLAALDLGQVYAVFLSEENVTWNGGLDYLNELYDYIKARHPTLPVYQWYSMPMLPHPKQRADGWIIDPYGFTRERFRRYLQKYLALGLPVIDCINASERPDFGQDSFDQVEVCREFNVPMFFYAVDNKLGSPAIWLRSDDPELKRRREWVQQVAARAHQTDTSKLPLETAEFSTGQPVELGGDEHGRDRYEEDFGQEGFLDDATIRGFTRLRWDGRQETLSFVPRAERSSEVELVYHFVSSFELSAPEAEVDGRADLRGAELELALSINGWRFEHGSGFAGGPEAGKFALRSSAADDEKFKGREFWVRLRGKLPAARAGACTLDGLKVVCAVALPDRREVVLKPDEEGAVSYREDFGSQKFRHLAELDNAARIEWHRGSIATRGVAGHSNVAGIRQKFVCARPVRSIHLTARCFAHRSLGSSNEIGLSLDGKAPLLRAKTSGREDKTGRFVGTLELDAATDKRFAGVKEFWVHLIMRNSSGVKTNVSNRFEWFKVSAEAE